MALVKSRVPCFTKMYLSTYCYRDGTLSIFLPHRGAHTITGLKCKLLLALLQLKPGNKEGFYCSDHSPRDTQSETIKTNSSKMFKQFKQKKRQEAKKEGKEGGREVLT